MIERDNLIRAACAIAGAAPWRQSPDMDVLKSAVADYCDARALSERRKPCQPCGDGWHTEPFGPYPRTNQCPSCRESWKLVTFGDDIGVVWSLVRSAILAGAGEAPLDSERVDRVAEEYAERIAVIFEAIHEGNEPVEHAELPVQRLRK